MPARSPCSPRREEKLLRGLIVLAGLSVGAAISHAADPLEQSFTRQAQPVLEKYCYDCHGNGIAKGGVTLDEFDGPKGLRDHKLWTRALKNVRAHIMPPADEEPLPTAEAEKLVEWIKREAFALDPARPDPGRPTVRRLNRVEYRNTIRELTGLDFDTQKEFPADDTGYGFDNIGDVLTISPMLLEKYLDAAQAIIAKTVPTQPRVVAEKPVLGRAFATVKVDTAVPSPTAAVAASEASPTNPAAVAAAAAVDAAAKGRRRAAPDLGLTLRRPAPSIEGESLDLSYYTPATVTAKHRVPQAGNYQLVVDLRTFERYVDDVFDLNRCQLRFFIDGEKVLEQDFVREGGRKFEFTYDRAWQAGDHELTFEVVPLTPDRPQPRQLRLRLNSVTVRGPMAPDFWVKPPGYEKHFPRDVPADLAARRTYARELLGTFATRAYRRPVATETLDRLVALAESVFTQPRQTFEAGVAQAMVAVLASPSFLFREESTLPVAEGETHPKVDEYTLASRLSYFLWSSMPDDELMRLAGAGRLRAELDQQITRLLNDPRASGLMRNFTGQWLQARDIANVPITALDVFLRDHPNPDLDRARQTLRRLSGKPSAARTAEENELATKARAVLTEFSRQPKPELTDELRRAMQQETELTFAHIVKEDRSVLELLESDYTFLNEDLARHYGIPGVTGRPMRKVTLPPGSPRGGVLTQGTVLAVTSNPTRTSPVKRGVFILDAILGTPPAPPPPNIPSLEDAASGNALKTLALRDTLALHAKDPMCHSCHSRMDPLGLALENFNALGQWRTTDVGQPIEPAGKLITGESFADVRELKHVLATSHRRDFYTCLTEKMLTYALGRGLDYTDVDTVDRLVDALEASGGRVSTLLRGIIISTPFQYRRAPHAPVAVNATPAAALAHSNSNSSR